MCCEIIVSLRPHKTIKSDPKQSKRTKNVHKCLEMPKTSKTSDCFSSHPAQWLYCDADQRGGPIARLSPSRAQSCQAFPKSSHCVFKKSKILPKFLHKPSPNPPKIFAKRAKIHPEALLEPILGKCLKEARFWTFKKRPRGGQKHPKEAQDDPKPLPNRAQDPPQIDFDWIFGRFLSSFKFA